MSELRQKLAYAWHMPFGQAQIATVEEVIRHADAQGIADLQYQARILATNAYNYGGEPAKAFVTFAWCLAAYDRGDADPAYDHNFYWHFKTMVNAMTNFPEVPLDRTYAVLDDMERRYRIAGHTRNPVHQHRELVARHVGDADTAAEQYRLWCAAPRGEMSDCRGCEPTSKVLHLSWLRRDEDAVAVAAPVLDGTLTCYEQPHAIQTSLLFPYLRTGRLSEAADAHRRAYRSMRTNRAEMSRIAEHVEFCARTGNHARGLELVDRHLDWLAGPPSPWADMRFSAAAALVLRQVADEGHGDTPVGESSVAALRDTLTDRARSLAQRFDDRNGTTAVGDRIAATLAAEPVVEHLPLSGLPVVKQAPAPATVELPDSPAELVELARTEGRLGNDHVVDQVWRRFDEVCPDPEPALLAPRLYDRAAGLVEEDPAEAERLMMRVAELYEQADDHVRALVTRGSVGLLWCQNGQFAEGLAEVEARTEELMAAGDSRDRATAKFRLGLAYQQAGRLDDAVATFGTAADLAGETAVSVAGDATMCLARTYADLGEEHRRTALDHADRAVAIFAGLGPCGRLRRAQFFAATMHGAAGELEQAYALFGEAAKTEDQTLRGHALHIQGKAALDLGRVEVARDLFAQAITVFGPAERHTAFVKVDFGAASLQHDRADDAANVLEDALSELTDAEEANRARFLLATAYRELGQHDQALTLLEQVASRCAADGNPAGVGQMRAMSGDILAKLDRDDEAAEQYTQAADSFHTAEIPLGELETRRKAAMSWWWASEVDRCLATLTAADTLTVGDEPQALWEKTMLAYDSARVLADLDRPADAAQRADAAVDGFRSLGAVTEAAVASVLHGRLLAELGRPAEAEKLLTAALADLPPEATGPREQVEELLKEIRS